MRQIVLDTETTGLEPCEGHRIIEIGCIELIDRRLTGNNFHLYLNPERAIDLDAVNVHGITAEFLAQKPKFAEIAESLLDYLRGAELIIHNAAFDVAFLDHELQLWKGESAPRVAELCGICDTLSLARQLFPGQRNSLDALCKRYAIDNSKRIAHGALLDAGLLAEVYLAMTGGQVALHLGDELRRDPGAGRGLGSRGHIDPQRPPLRVVRASDEEEMAHRARLAAIEAASGQCVWLSEDRSV
ncbi:DNA polymerase III subunit epsilon [Caldichromatium japonicum]|uniref:DNA polymerase III subunit epsilon n=1 Tax=Caldichromatium japonicum TaxID=2699430 RepID=A0A6G7VC67_9GAMM|nr:DNA polymerase III subunit epsilon [Caldichromatium japonicum]QIK37611.1 DNA polymerase III subunit epsilon [Caldichromatium japonicum]